MALELTRYIVLMKFVAVRATHGEDLAIKMSEPEDQDYHGIGGRHARMDIHLIIAIVFCTLDPVVLLIAFIVFGVKRIIYGYLIIFAETKKPDLGGVFWVNSLKHVQYGLVLYVLLMVGFLEEREGNNAGPCLV